VRVIAVSSVGVLDTETGELSPTIDVEKLLTTEPGGVISGNNLYPYLAALAPEVRKDEGWTMTVNLQERRIRPLDSKDTRITGKLYVSKLTYRRAKVGGRRNRRRPPAIKWVVLELGLFIEKPPTDVHEIAAIGHSFIELAERRGIKPRSSPGSFGSAMLRASSKWNKERHAAPEFVSEVGRRHLPGNYYALSNEFKRKVPHAYYMDQESSHHKIAASVPLPHPHSLRARGFFRATEHDVYRKWTTDLSLLDGQHGLTCCMVHCGTIPHRSEHLYPPWAKERGTKPRWIWTPELRLLQQGDHRMQFEYVICALTSRFNDDALLEYAEWALEQRKRTDSKWYKSALLAAYGMLAIRHDRERPVSLFTVHGRPKPPRATVVELPLLPNVYRSDVKRMKPPAVQNVIARGVIEAETRTRSLEYAKQLEGEGTPVPQIYADGLLAALEQVPMFVPEHWRVAAALSDVFSPHPNSIISNELVRLPGILGSARAAYGTPWEAPAIRESLEARSGDLPD
jgi:hypothetical protein